MTSLYDTDFYAWTQEQAGKLRALLTSRTDLDLDLENLIEEIDSLGRNDLRQLEDRLAEIDLHLLKLAFSLSWEPRRQWQLTVQGHRWSIERLLDECPSLRPMLPAMVEEAHEHALHHFDMETLIKLTMPVLPGRCPFAVEDMLNTEWWPDPRGEA